jgi:tetratricopeptide (TPR) repeat protein
MAFTNRSAHMVWTGFIIFLLHCSKTCPQVLPKSIFCKTILITLLFSALTEISAAHARYEFQNTYTAMDAVQRDAAIAELSAKHFKKPANPLLIRQLAEAYTAKNESDSAISYWSLLANIETQNDTAFYTLAELYCNANSLDSALSMIEKAVALQPARTDYISLQAITLYKLQKTDAAQALCEKILTQSPSDVNALLLSGIILRDQKKNEAAMERFEKCLKADPANTEALVYRAELYLQADKYNEALKDYIAARADLSANADILNNMGICHYKSGAYQEAINFFRKAIAVDRHHPQSYFNEGLAYIHLNDLDTASRDIKTASALWDTSKVDTCHSCFLDAIYYLGMCYKKTGDLPAARKCFESLQKENYSQDLSNEIRMIDVALFISRNWYYIAAVLILFILLMIAIIKVIRKK